MMTTAPSFRARLPLWRLSHWLKDHPLLPRALGGAPASCSAFPASDQKGARRHKPAAARAGPLWEEREEPETAGGSRGGSRLYGLRATPPRVARWSRTPQTPLAARGVGNSLGAVMLLAGGIDEAPAAPVRRLWRSGERGQQWFSEVTQSSRGK